VAKSAHDNIIKLFAPTDDDLGDDQE